MIQLALAERGLFDEVPGEGEKGSLHEAGLFEVV